MGTLGDLVGVDEQGFARVDARVALGALTHVLKQRDRLVLYLRFGEDLTQRAIGERIGISQMQVSRILRSSIRRLGDRAEQSPIRHRRRGRHRSRCRDRRRGRRAAAHRLRARLTRACQRTVRLRRVAGRHRARPPGRARGRPWWSGVRRRRLGARRARLRRNRLDARGVGAPPPPPAPAPHAARAGLGVPPDGPRSASCHRSRFGRAGGGSAADRGRRRSATIESEARRGRMPVLRLVSRRRLGLQRCPRSLPRDWKPAPDDVRRKPPRHARARIGFIDVPANALDVGALSGPWAKALAGFLDDRASGPLLS